MKFVSLTFLLIGIVLALGCTPNPSVFSTPVASTSPAAVAVTASPTPTSTTEMVKGKVVPVRFARLAFGASGFVGKVFVKEGETVQAGALIAELDLRELNLRVQAAQDQLTIAQASFAQTKALATKEEIAAAQAAYESAAAAYAKLQRGPSPEELVTLKVNMEKAKAARDQAQAAYDRSGGSTNPYIAMLPVSLQLQQATLDFQAAEANYLRSIKPDPADLAQAKSQLAQAEAAYALKKTGARPEDIALAQARVQQAQTALDQAKLEITKARLTAPHDGNVVGIAMREGEIMQAGSLAATLVNLAELRVETTELDEYAVTNVKIGQAVRITVDALPGKTFTGKVVSIMPPQVPLQADGNPFYVATITLDAQDPALRYGMTVRVDFSN